MSLVTVKKSGELPVGEIFFVVRWRKHSLHLAVQACWQRLSLTSSYIGVKPEHQVSVAAESLFCVPCVLKFIILVICNKK